VVVLALGLFFGCAHVPPEAVQLSYQIGEDLPKLHASYDLLVQQRFEDLRRQRSAYVDEVWAPAFLARWIAAGRLVEVAQGSVVWSFESTAFVAPTTGKEKVELLSTVSEWANQAIAQISKKRAALLDPLDQQERDLRAKVAEAFSRVVQANAYITAHLESLQHVEQAQDEALKAFKLKDLRDEIDNTLAKVSDEAAKGLEKVREADGLLEKAKGSMTQKP